MPITRAQTLPGSGLMRPAAHSVLCVIRLRMTEGIMIYLIFPVMTTIGGVPRVRSVGTTTALAPLVALGAAALLYLVIEMAGIVSTTVA